MKFMSEKKFALSQKNKVKPYNVVIVGTGNSHNAGYLNCKDNEINRVTTSQPKVWDPNLNSNLS